MSANLVQATLTNVEVMDAAFSEAIISFQDGSRLRLVHRVGERWLKVEEDATTSVAAKVLARVATFRLNAKHLELLFDDGSRWEAGFAGRS